MLVILSRSEKEKNLLKQEIEDYQSKIEHINKQKVSINACARNLLKFEVLLGTSLADPETTHTKSRLILTYSN